MAHTLKAGFLSHGQVARVVQAASDGIGILALLDRQPDLVVIDLAPPHKSSFEILKEIRGISNVPLVLLIGLGNEGDGIRGLELGADAYVARPLSPLAFAARVNALLRRTRLNKEMA